MMDLKSTILSKQLKENEMAVHLISIKTYCGNVFHLFRGSLCFMCISQLSSYDAKWIRGIYMNKTLVLWEGICLAVLKKQRL